MHGNCRGINPDLHNSFAQQTVKDLSPFTSHFSRKLTAFTLAEVLITLGIIGVVAALTMPVLMAHHQKQVVVTSLKKSYSVFQQAIKLAEVDFGSFDNINPPEIDHNADSMEQWWNTYLAKYFNGVKLYKQHQWLIVNYNDGSGVGIKSTRTDKINFITINCVKLQKCLENEFQKDARSGADSDGKNSFVFIFNNGKYLPQGTGLSHEALLNAPNYGCINAGSADVNGSGVTGRYCATLIMQNGWQIPYDYPVKF